ncbi:MAG: antirestriction protein ArdA [Polyangiaceae bacterium]
MSDHRIYVACLAAYNAGRLHGAWIDVDPDDPDALHQAIAAMLAASPIAGAEEWAIHDYEMGGLKVHEHEELSDVLAMARLLDEHGELVGMLARSYSDQLSDIARMAPHYLGAFDRLADWAEQWLEDTGSLDEVPERWRPYLDFDAWARDAELNGDVIAVEDGGRVHVFEGSP